MGSGDVQFNKYKTIILHTTLQQPIYKHDHTQELTECSDGEVNSPLPVACSHISCGFYAWVFRRCDFVL